MDSHLTSQPSPPDPTEQYDPAQGASQVAYRSFAGEHPESGQRVLIGSMAIAFRQLPQSRARYRRLIALCNAVSADATVVQGVLGVDAVYFSSMPERTDMGGEYATTWITAPYNRSAQRGALIVKLNGIIVHILTVSPLPFAPYPHAASIGEGVIIASGMREPEIPVANQVDKPALLARLVNAREVSDWLDRVEMTANWYDDTLNPN